MLTEVFEGVFYQHLKTKGCYRVLSAQSILEADLTPVVVYMSVDTQQICII